MTGRRAVSVSPHRFQAVIFDLDGVIINTAGVHAAAWKRLFDEYLTTEAPEDGDRAEFTDEVYVRYVDGRARIDGVEAFLSSRGIQLPRGEDTDPPVAATAWGLANRKNQYFLEVLATKGVEVLPSSVALCNRYEAAVWPPGWSPPAATGSRSWPQPASGSCSTCTWTESTRRHG